jgi:hypothetical protein
MVKTLSIAFGAAVVVLALSWVVSYAGFRKLGPERGPRFTSAIGQLTGSILVFGALVTVVVLAVQAIW